MWSWAKGSLRKQGPVLSAAIGFFVAACGGGAGSSVVDPVAIDPPFFRLDQALFHAPPDSIASVSLRLYAEQGDFYRLYVEEILRAAPIDDPRLGMALLRFTQDPDWSAVQRSADSIFGDMEAQRTALTVAFGRLKALFPDRPVPRIVVFNSGFNYAISPTDSVLGIGVEWFVGADHPVVRYLAPDAFPNYVKERMRPAMLVPSAVKGWVMVHFLEDAQGKDLLTHLVAVGKVMALVQALLPEEDPASLLGYTPEQVKWCEANEYNIWKELVGKQMLYSGDDEVIGRIMNDGPFTNGFPHESPGQIGQWIGLRMVTNYLKDHPNTTFAQLFALDDPREVLKSYRPR